MAHLIGGVDEHLYRRKTVDKGGDRRAYTQFRHLQGYDAYVESSLAKWMLLFNVLGAVAHTVGVVLTYTQARHSFRLQIMRLTPINFGTATTPQLGRVSVVELSVYPTWIVLSFFAISLGFHVFISLVMTTQLLRGRGQLTDWYMKCLYFCYAPWVRYTHT